MEIKKLHQDDLQRLMRRSAAASRAGGAAAGAGAGWGVGHRQFLDEALEKDHLAAAAAREGGRTATRLEGGGRLPRGWSVTRRCGSS